MPLPSFDSVVDIRSDAGGGVGPVRVAGVQARFVPQYHKMSDPWGTGVGAAVTHRIYFPARTDVRDAGPTQATVQLLTGGDWVEFPVASGNFFRVVLVTDWFRDSADEFRVAAAFRWIPNWPMP